MPHIVVDSIVAARNQEPYVRMSVDGKFVAQLTMSETRKIANDLYLAASRAEVDAMIVRFFAQREFPREAAAALLVDFRDFRLGLDLDTPEGTYVEPDDNAPQPDPPAQP